MAYKGSKKPLRFLPTTTIASAFMRCEERKVDKSGCISFVGKKYEAGVLLIGQTVNVIYDPADIETVTIEHSRSGIAFQIKELKIGVHTQPRSRLPKTMTRAIPETSRFLDEKEKRYQQRQEAVRRAISYKDLNASETGIKGSQVLPTAKPAQESSVETFAGFLNAPSEIFPIGGDTNV
jgi:hypothetical protein